MGYIEGLVREQQMLFPSTLDEYVGENNEVRAIAAFIEHLEFGEMGFERSEPAVEGRPGYDPRTLMGIFIWGHLNGVRTSRRLERECARETGKRQTFATTITHCSDLHIQRERRRVLTPAL